MRNRTVIYYTAEDDWYDEPQDGKRILVVHKQPFHYVHIYRSPTLASCERLGRIIDNQRWSLTVDMTDGLTIASEPNQTYSPLYEKVS